MQVNTEVPRAVPSVHSSPQDPGFAALAVESTSSVQASGASGFVDLGQPIREGIAGPVDLLATHPQQAVPSSEEQHDNHYPHGKDAYQSASHEQQPSPMQQASISSSQNAGMFTRLQEWRLSIQSQLAEQALNDPTDIYQAAIIWARKFNHGELCSPFFPPPEGVVLCDTGLVPALNEALEAFRPLSDFDSYSKEHKMQARHCLDAILSQAVLATSSGIHVLTGSDKRFYSRHPATFGTRAVHLASMHPSHEPLQKFVEYFGDSFEVMTALSVSTPDPASLEPVLPVLLLLLSGKFEPKWERYFRVPQGRRIPVIDVTMYKAAIKMCR